MRSEPDQSPAQANAPPSGTHWALEATTDCVILLDREFRIAYVNRAAAELNGFRPEDVLGRTNWEVWPSMVGTETERHYREAMATGEPRRFQQHYVGHEGLDLWLEIHAYPSPDGLAVFFKDVTEGRRLGKARAEQETRLESAMRATDLGTWRCDLPIDDHPFYWSPQVRRHFGISDDEEVGVKDFMELLHPDDRRPTADAMARAIEERVPYDVEYRTLGRDGRTRWVRATGNAFYREDGTPYRFDGFTVELTSRVEAEAALRESEARFREMADHAPMMVWVTESDGTCTYLSQSWYEFTGQTPETGLGYGWVQATHPDDQALAERAFVEANRNHEPFWVEYRLRRADGEYRWAIDSAKARFGPGGQFVGYIGSVIDITERKAAEEALRRSNEELEAKVLERTAQLADAVKEAEGFNYSVAHDLRAPVRAISSTSRILLEDVGSDLTEEHREMLQRQSYNAQRLGTLIDELLRLSRLARAKVNRAPLDMTAKARSVAAEIDPPCRVEVQDGMRAEGDPGLVRTVLHNLIGNAYKFSPEGGTVRVGQEGEAFFVRDEGIGFDMRYAPKMFLPFERLVTEAEFDGTGIGLANVERIVRRHGGRVWAESEGPGKGATFYFTLGAATLSADGP